MKKIIRCALIVAATVIALFFILAIALYIPPIQNYAVRKATEYASEKTGMTIRVERVRLAFPLDLALINSFASQKGDTLLDAHGIRVDIAIMPLFKQEVNIEGLSIHRTKINTAGLISNTQIKGYVGTLGIKSKGINLKQSTVRLNDASLKDAHINITLCDTAAEDTTPSQTAWRIKADRLLIENSSVNVRMPDDSMRIATTLGNLLMKDGSFDLKRNSYEVASLALRSCGARYDIPYAAAHKGFDANHIHVSELNTSLKDILYRNGAISANVAALSAKEKSGIAINRLAGKFFMDSTKLSLSGFMLRTPYSTLDATAAIDLSALRTGGKGKAEATIKGDIDTRDIGIFVPEGISDEARKAMPKTPLKLSATVGGTNGILEIRNTGLRVKNALAFNLSGTLTDITEANRKGNLKYSLKAYNLDFLKPLTGNGISIPHGTSANGTISFNGNKYATNSTLNAERGKITVNGSYDTDNESYAAKIDSRQFPLRKIMKGSTLHDLTAHLSVKGRGFDPFSKSMTIDTRAEISEFGISEYNLSNMTLQAALKNGIGNVTFGSDNDLLNGKGSITALFARKNVTATTQAIIKRLNLGKLTGKADTLLLSTKMSAEIHADNKLAAYGTNAKFDSIRIITAKGNYPAKDLYVNFDNRKDSLFASLAAGDLNMNIAAKGNLDNLLGQVDRFVALIEKQIDNKKIDQNKLRGYFPDMNLHIAAGNDNPISNIFRYSSGYKFDSTLLDISSSPEKGLNGYGHIYSFNTGTLLLDTVRIKLFQDSTGIRMKGNVYNVSKNNPYIFRAKLNGYLYSDGAGMELVYIDKTGKEGMNVGVQAILIDSGVSVHLYPETPIIAYRNFKVNKDNYITLKEDKTILADLNLIADDGTGLSIYTTDNDSTNDVTMAINHLNLKELTSSIPYAPNISGLLSGDLHLLKKNTEVSAAYAVNIADMGYDDVPLGNLGMEGTYLPDEKDGSHNINALITREETEIAGIDGAYFEKKDSLAAKLSLLDFPIDILNGFTGDMLGMNGNLNGDLDISGSASEPIFNGMVKLDSVHVYSDIYGFNFNVQNDSAQVKNSSLLMKNLRFHSTGKNPLVINGGIDFSNFEKVSLNISVNANNFELVDAKQTKKSQIYGKVFSDVNASVRGTVDNLQIRGKLNILSNTNVSYVLQDSPLSIDNRLNELVTFVDFSDSTKTAASQLESEGIDMILGINISEVARLHCDISSDKQSYVDIEGGGNLTFKYTPQGEVILTGRYTVSSGEMKYALPIIPLSTFYITNGSYIEFTGDPTNPTLNIQAKEQIKASVTENNVSRSVTFNAGISITQPLSKMGLEFTIEAPEDQTVQNQLAAMSTEQRNKLAISMLATGMYLEESNTSNGFKANNALNAFLQSEVQQIAGNALRTIDLSVSVEDATSETGETNTDYSFQFAKKFWGNRVNVIIGGRVSTGNDARNDATSFIDNISLEYRLDNSASRYVRLFYDHNKQDPLEGQLTEMGAGLVMRRKTNTFGEIFQLWKRKKKDNPLQNDNGPASNADTEGTENADEKHNQK